MNEFGSRMNLAICIPTYNRAESAVKQIEFLLNEIKHINNSIDIGLFVKDNCSSSIEFQKLEIHNKQKQDYKLSQNKRNLGLVGNLLQLHKEVHREYNYIWYVGDDDLLHTGILNSVISKINQGFDFIFINHEGIEGESILMQSAVDLSKKTEKASILDVFEHSGTTMMFITACIYKTKLLTKAIKSDFLSEGRLTSPLYWSFFCSKINLGIIQDILITNKRGKTSWDNVAGVVFGFWLPIELFRNIFISKHKLKSIYIFLRYLPACSKHLIKYTYIKLSRSD